MTNEIALLPPRETAIEVFSSDNGLDPFLAKIREEIDTFIPCVSTRKGRDAIASMAYKVSQSKAALDKLGKELVDELKEKPKLIDAERKRMRDLLDLWRDEVRLPLTKFEQAEEARIENHKNAIKSIVDIGNGFIGGMPQPFGLLFAELDMIKVDESFQEFESEAHREKESAKAKLDQAFTEHQKREAEKSELEKFRAEAAQREQKEREERIAREAAESARLAAEKAAADERQKIAIEQARKELEAQAAIDRANREKLEAENARLRQEQEAKAAAERAEQEKQRAIEAERQRIEGERLAEIAAAELREKNKAHAKKINNEALADLIKSSGITDEQAKKIVTAIAKGEVRNVQINY
jgi:hypothetical protein